SSRSPGRWAMPRRPTSSAPTDAASASRRAGTAAWPATDYAGRQVLCAAGAGVAAGTCGLYRSRPPPGTPVATASAPVARLNLPPATGGGGRYGSRQARRKPTLEAERDPPCGRRGRLHGQHLHLGTRATRRREPAGLAVAAQYTVARDD